MATLTKKLTVKDPEYWVGKTVTLTEYNFQMSKYDDPEDMGLETVEQRDELFKHLGPPTPVKIVSVDVDTTGKAEDAYYTFEYPDGYLIESCDLYRIPSEMVQAGLEQSSDF